MVFPSCVPPQRHVIYYIFYFGTRSFAMKLLKVMHPLHRVSLCPPWKPAVPLRLAAVTSHNYTCRSTDSDTLLSHCHFSCTLQKLKNLKDTHYE